MSRLKFARVVIAYQFKMISSVYGLDKIQTLDGKCLIVIPPTFLCPSNVVSMISNLHFPSDMGHSHQESSSLAPRTKTSRSGKPDSWTSMLSKEDGDQRGKYEKKGTVIFNGVRKP